MNTINRVSLKGKRVLIRVDFNVPLDENLNITNDSRMVAALPTIKKVVSDGGMAIIISHLGRPKNGFEEKFSLKHTVKHLSNLIAAPVAFSSDCIGKNTTTDVVKMNKGGLFLLHSMHVHRSGNETRAAHQAPINLRQKSLPQVQVLLG